MHAHRAQVGVEPERAGGGRAGPAPGAPWPSDRPTSGRRRRRAGRRRRAWHACERRRRAARSPVASMAAPPISCSSNANACPYLRATRLEHAARLVDHLGADAVTGQQDDSWPSCVQRSSFVRAPRCCGRGAIRPYSMPSASACHEASRMLGDAPTVRPARARRRAQSISTRVIAAVPSRAVEDAHLVVGEPDALRPAG